MTTTNSPQQEVETLMSMNPDQQYILLAARLQQLAGTSTVEGALAGPPDALIKFGQQWLSSFVTQVYDRICDEQGDWHKDVANAAKGGVSALGISLATLAITTLGVAAPVAAAIGAIVASQYFKGALEMGGQATVDALCKTLKQYQPKQ